ncbi:hypothetical protein Enr17x_51020 [Gimesia fumaroli]|uniref:Uncharacterized protein n=1 Tax=Gimesia fumaroli TaxID=2527976 RepID=A0A518IIV6_9PLAN|nr:hypothetical protein Enr17x_51020 [Gimesia fumaroli]
MFSKNRIVEIGSSVIFLFGSGLTAKSRSDLTRPQLYPYLNVLRCYGIEHLQVGSISLARSSGIHEEVSAKIVVRRTRANVCYCRGSVWIIKGDRLRKALSSSLAIVCFSAVCLSVWVRCYLVGFVLCEGLFFLVDQTGANALRLMVGWVGHCLITVGKPTVPRGILLSGMMGC